jgi:transposase
MAHKKKSKGAKKAKLLTFDVLEQLNLNAAGIDIGSQEIYVSVPDDRDSEAVRKFSSFTTDLYDLAKWLKDCHIDTVAMESTSVYWVSLFDILEEQGFEVYLVNARHVKNVSGRKTDVLDCQWIRQLHTYGLLSASFHPPEDIRAVRALVRHRDMLTKYRASHIQHMQKALDLMNLKLHLVLSDITGQTGMNIIRAILAGEQRAESLAEFRHGRCKYSKEDIIKALTGHYRQEQLFSLKQAVELYDFYSQQVIACDAELESHYQSLKQTYKPTTNNPKPKKTYQRYNDANFDLSSYLYELTGVDLTAIDGLKAISVQNILVEVGLDMTKFKSAKHFASYLGLAPNNKISGGKVLRRKTAKVVNAASNAFRMAAQSVHANKSSLGAFYRRIRAKHGSPVAITATANKIARIFYTILRTKTPYAREESDSYNESFKKLQLKHLTRQAAKLGLTLQPTTAT